MTSHLEVAKCTLGDWENAILTGYKVWREVEKNKKGTVIVDLNARKLTLKNIDKLSDHLMEYAS
jgi:hypothetical protein